MALRNLERLESRLVPANAYISAGTLYVVGSDAAEVIVVRQTGTNSGTLTSDGRVQSFTNVRHVYVEAKGGNDYVLMDTTALGVNEAKLSLTARLCGGAGNDTLIGGAGNDLLNGDAGNDQLFGNPGHDSVYGGDGNDLLSTGLGNDIAYGDLGDDRLYGGSGNDQAFGGGGMDYLEGGTGSDGLQGGSGFDTYRNAATVDAISDEADPEDVRQGLSGTCVILASLQAVTGTGIDLTTRIRKLSTNYYTVSLYNPARGWTNQVVFYDGSWNDNDPAPTADGNAWVLIFQRAYLQDTGVNWADPDAANWTNRYGNEFQEVDRAYIALLGQAQWIGSRIDGLTDADRSLLQQKFAANRPLIALTRPANSTAAADMTRLGLVNSHAYSVIGFGSKNGQLTVRLRNPWGTDGPSVLYGANDGIIELQWSDFRRVMLGFCVG